MDYLIIFDSSQSRTEDFETQKSLVTRMADLLQMDRSMSNFSRVALVVYSGETRKVYKVRRLGPLSFHQIFSSVRHRPLPRRRIATSAHGSDGADERHNVHWTRYWYVYS